MKRTSASALFLLALFNSASAQQPDFRRANAATHDQEPIASAVAGSTGAGPDVSLTDAPTTQRLPTLLDAQIASRIDKALTAAGEASTIPADYAFGAFQRGYFLTAFALGLERAKQGDAAAQTLLGELLSRGLGVKQDLATAADWYGLAAVQGEAEAIYALGRFHLDGRGVRQDVSRAADLLELAAKKGHAVAAREFAYLLLQGKGRERNALLGAAYLRRAAGLGDMDAQFALGGLYMEGVGVVRNDAQAARWYGEAARNGHVGAEVQYAIMLFNGRGVKKDEAVAARWLRKAAGADNPLAQVRLARLYAEGRGVDKNPVEAARWYLIANSRGIEDPAMEDWLKGLDGQTLNEAVAVADEWSSMRQISRPVAAAPTSTRAPAAAAIDNSPE